jgi:hypothetical protein
VRSTDEFFIVELVKCPWTLYSVESRGNGGPLLVLVASRTSSCPRGFKIWVFELSLWLRFWWISQFWNFGGFHNYEILSLSWVCNLFSWSLLFWILVDFAILRFWDCLEWMNTCYDMWRFCKPVWSYSSWARFGWILRKVEKTPIRSGDVPIYVVPLVFWSSNFAIIFLTCVLTSLPNFISIGIDLSGFFLLGESFRAAKNRLRWTSAV